LAGEGEGSGAAAGEVTEAELVAAAAEEALAGEADGAD